MHRDQPTWRIPAGVIALIIALTLYGIAIASLVPPLISDWHALAQAPIYLLLGIIWLLPLRRFLIWMETGRWSAPAKAEISSGPGTKPEG
ncbi:MAG: DUF2842 domain-containing protein [Sphingomonadaceae bacterium]|nr:DUF2842 domain-containing protein [Sphingomonadaceae bacterium]